MTAVPQVSNEHIRDNQKIVDQIWLKEENLATAHKDLALLDQVAPDFVSFDAQGNSISKTEYGDHFISAGEVNLTRLWGHFGSEKSCCLAYLKEQSDGVVDICMALWIECDGAWRKTFHHQNVKFG